MIRLVFPVFLIFAFSFCHIASGCTLPSYLTGDWDSPFHDVVTLNSTHMTGYVVYTYTNLVFQCHLASGGKYVLRSDDFTVLGGNVVNAAICLQFTKLSNDKIKYFILTSQLADANYERVKFVTASRTDVTVNEVCDQTSVASIPQETKILVKTGAYLSQKVRCPNDILGTYWYVNHTGGCTESEWDVCDSRDTMTFNYTLCSDTQAFSANGTAYCMYQAAVSGEALVYVYNGDNTVDGSTTYRFTCMVVNRASDGYVYVTQYPKDCYINQTSTYVPTGGTTITLSANVPPTDSAASVASAGLIAGLVILFLILIVAGAVGGYYIYMKKFKKVDHSDKKPIDDENRGLEPVTPSVVNAEMQDTKSPRNNPTSHGKRHQKIAVKKVAGPLVPLPPQDTRNKNPRRRRRPDQQSLITPLTVLPASADDLSVEYVQTVPIQLQLPLKRHDSLASIRGLSRQSTIFEDKIGITVSSARTRPPISRHSTKKSLAPPLKTSTPFPPSTPRPPVTPKTPNKPTKPRKPTTPGKPFTPRSNGSRSRQTPTSQSTVNRSRRGGIAVKKLDESKTGYVRYANAVFKDVTGVYRKKIKLVGKIKKPKRNEGSAKSVKLQNVTKRLIESGSERKSILKRPTTQDTLLSFDLVKEMNRPGKKLDIKEPEKTETKEEVNPSPIPETTLVDDDSNYFTCSNDVDSTFNQEPSEAPSVFELALLKQKADKFIYDRTDFFPKRVPLVNRREKYRTLHVPLPPKKPESKIKQIFKKVEEVAKFSMLRHTLSAKKSTVAKNKKESVIEEKVLSQIFYSRERKADGIKQRRKQKPVSLDANKHYQRLPTLVNWVECTDVLATPAMKMQKKLNNTDTPFAFDNVKNKRFKPTFSIPDAQCSALREKEL